MKPSKLILVAAVAAFVFGTGTVARAIIITYPWNTSGSVADGTYVFTATDGHTFTDGSTVTFSGKKLIDWDILDTIDNYEFKTSNSQIDPNAYQSGVYGVNQWSFNIISLTPDAYGDPRVGIGNTGNTSGAGSIYVQPSYTATLPDPTGNWTLIAANTAQVPDASGTFGLLAGALIALGACKLFLSGREGFQA